MHKFDLRPMEPQACAEAFTKQGWLYQVKWDGIRMLALWQGTQVHLLNRKGADRTEQYPEIAALRHAFPGNTVVDGELVVFEEGRPKFELVLRRDQRRQEAAIREGVQHWPVHYMVFDILYFQDKDLRTQPLARRQEILQACWPTDSLSLHAVDSVTDGQALFACTAANGLEGIVAKNCLSSYIPGKSDNWLKIKHWQYIDCVVGGYALRSGKPAALLLGLYNCKEELEYVGRVGSGLKEQDWQALDQFLKMAIQRQCPFIALPPTRRDGTVVRWLAPWLAARIKFMHLTDGGRLRSPIVIDFGMVSKDVCNFVQKGILK